MSIDIITLTASKNYTDKQIEKASMNGADLSKYVQSVNGVGPDKRGNVELSVENVDFVVQDTAPEDTSVLWVDPTDNTEDNSGSISITGAKVGQTIKIAEVDKNGVPTAWEAVEFPSEGEYELIETVTLQEDIAHVYLNTYPDGNDYALKALFVRVTTPGDAAQRAGYVFAFGDQDRKIEIGGGCAPRMVNTTARTTTFVCRAYHGRWESILYGSVENETNSDTPSNYPRLQGLYSTEQYPVITGVQVYCKERTSAGTVIEIWGIKE